MKPDSRFAIALLISLAVAAPGFFSAAGGDVGFTTAIVRGLLTFVGAWFAIGALGHLAANYATTVNENDDTDGSDGSDPDQESVT